MWAESEVDEGATFYITFGGPDAACMLPDETDVLLVQDNPLEVELTLRPLRDLDPACRIGVARDGEEALDYLLGRGAFRHRLGAPLPRLVLLDLQARPGWTASKCCGRCAPTPAPAPPRS